MSDIDHISEDLFFKLRNRFPKVNMGDENGQTTTNPLESRFFNFKFEHEGKKYGQVTCSLIDNQALKVYFNQGLTEDMDEATEENWYQFLKELRKFAKTNMLTFDVRDITKDTLDQKDIEFVSKHAKEKSAVQESKINWERHGRFSEGNHKSIKIHVVHNNKLDENPNNRLIGIEKIYLVNENKERFLLPFVSVSGAKAMAMHCAQGGTPYDVDGTTITKAVTEMKNLSRFGMALRNKTFESEEPMKVVRASKHIKEQIKKNLYRMAGARSFAEGMEGLRSILAAESRDQTEVLKDWFIQNTYDDKLDTWLESATNALRRCMEQNVNLSEEDDKIDYSDAILDKDQTAKRAAKPAQIGSSLELYANSAKDEEMMSLIKSQPMRGMIRLILADIAARAVDDETAILASKADMGEFTIKHKQMIEIYLKDLYGENPPRKEPEAKKDLYGKKKSPEDEFEEEIMKMGEEDMDEVILSPSDQPDPVGDAQQAQIGQALSPGGSIDTGVKNSVAGVSNDNMPGNEEEEELESIGDRHKRERFKSIKKINNRLKNESDESMEAGVCNHTSEGAMCPVHGMEECGSGMGSATIVVGEEEQVADEGSKFAEEKKDVERYDRDDDSHSARKKIHTDYEERWGNKRPDDWRYGIDEPSLTRNDPDVDEGNEFSGELAKAKASHKDEFEVDGKKYKVKEGAKPDFLDMDKDGDKKEPMKKALRDKKEVEEHILTMRRLAGLSENYIYAQEEEDPAAAVDAAVSGLDAEAPAEDPAAAAPAEAPAAPASDFTINDWEKVAALKDHYLDKGANDEEAQSTSAKDLGFDPAVVSAWVEKNQPSQGIENERGKRDEETPSDEESNDKFEPGDEDREQISKFAESNKKKPDADKDGIPDWADKRPNKADGAADRKRSDEALEKLKMAAGIW